MPILAADAHEEPRHQWKMKRHVTFITVTEIGTDVGRPLIRFRQQDAALVALVDPLSNILQILVRFRQVLADRALSLDQIRYGITPEPIHPLIKPKGHHLQHGLAQLGIIIIEVRLVAEESMPVILLCYRVPGPIGSFSVKKNDRVFLFFFVAFPPDVKAARGRWGGSSALQKPGMLMGGVFEHGVCDDTNPPP